MSKHEPRGGKPENRIPDQLDDVHMRMDDFKIAESAPQPEVPGVGRVQDTLEQQRRQYYDLFDFAPDGYLLTDANGRIWEANLAASSLLNVPQDRLPGKNLPDFIPGAGKRAFRSRLARLDEVNKVSDWEVTLIPREKSPIEVSITAAAVRNRDGDVTSLRWMIRDTTDRRQFEQTLLHRARISALSADIGHALTSKDSLRGCLQRCTDALVQHMDVAFARIWVLNEGIGSRVSGIGSNESESANPKPYTLNPIPFLELQASSGMYTEIDGPHSRVQLGKTIIGIIAQDRIPHLTNQMQQDPRVADKEWARQEKIVAFAGHPLIIENRLVGVMAIFSRCPLQDGTDRDLTLIADSIASVIERKRGELEILSLNVQLQSRLEMLTSLRQIDMAISQSLDLRLTLTILLDQLTSQLRVHAADVLLLNPHSQMLEYAAGRGFRTLAITRAKVRMGEGYAGQAAFERRMVALPNLKEQGIGSRVSGIGLDSDTLDPKPYTQYPDEGFAAYYAVPLMAKGIAKGVLEIYHREPLQPDNEWLEFLETLARQAAIALDNAALFDDLQRTNSQLMLAYDATIEGWSRALDLRDRETEGHTQRVTELTIRLARAAGMTDADLVHIRRGALLHDIGKMGIPDSILLKPGPLTDEETQVMRKHPVYAYEMLSPIMFLRPALDIPHYHHEKWDGTGYPYGMAGERIPEAARLFAVADVWDALRSDRPYREGWPEEKVREHIRSLSGTHFDPRVVDLFLRITADQENLYRRV